MFKLLLNLFIFLLISKEFLYISDEFIVILSFIIVITIFFNKLSAMLSASLDEYSQRISVNAKELILLQQKVLKEAKEYQQELLNMSFRIQLLSSYILEELSTIGDFCHQKYTLLLESYINSRLVSLLLLDLEYYESNYNYLILEDLDQIILNSLLEYIKKEEESATESEEVFFPFVDEESEVE